MKVITEASSLGEKRVTFHILEIERNLFSIAETREGNLKVLKNGIVAYEVAEGLIMKMAREESNKRYGTRNEKS